MLKLPRGYSSDFRLLGKKPIGAVDIDWNNPLAKKLYSVMYDGVTVGTQESNGISRVTLGGKGYGCTVSSGTTAWSFPKLPTVSAQSTHSVFIAFHQNTFTSSASGRVLYCERPNDNQIFKIVSKADGTYSWVIRNASGTGLQNRPISVDRDTTRDFHTLMFEKTSDTDRKLYVDDNLGVYTGSSGGTYNAVIPELLVDPQDSAVANPDTTIFVVYTFAEALTEREYRSLKNDPYQLVKPKSAPIYYPTDAGGSISVTETSQTLNITSQDPGIAFTGSISITESVSTLDLTSNNPVIDFTATLTVQESSSTLNVSTHNPAITLTATLTIEESVGIINLTGLDPTVTLTPPNTLVITESSQTINITGYDPIITFSGTLTIEETAQTINFTVRNPVIQIGAREYTQVFVGIEKDYEFTGTIKQYDFAGIITEAQIFSGTTKAATFLGVTK